jgi:hypothetical protein
MIKKIILYELQLAVFKNNGNIYDKRFLSIYSFQVFLKNANLCSCLFRFVPVFTNIIRLVLQHRPGFHQKYRQLSVEINIALIDSTVSVLCCDCSGR